MKKGKIILFSGLGAAVVLAAGISVRAYQTSGSGKTETIYKETAVESGTLTVGVTESGSVAIGTLTQDFELDLSGAAQSSSSGQQSGMSGSSSAGSSSTVEALIVEEVYVSAGRNVAEGDALLKLTNESVEKYHSQLKEAVTTASAELSEAKLSAEKQKLSARYSYDLSIAGGSVAKEEYRLTLNQLKEAVDEAQEAVDESASLINYYQEQIDSGIDLSASLEKEQENYDALFTKLKSAQNNYTIKSIEAEKKYQEAMLSYENAKSQYSVDVTGAGSSISQAEETLEEAEEILAEFEEVIGDGIICAEYSGTIMEISYQTGDELTTDTSIATYDNADSVTITVSVSEEDISEITIGDNVYIELTAYEDTVFEGVVQSMDTSVSSGSSTVSYQVTAAFTGDVTGIYTDMTGNVTFIQKQVEDVLYVSNKAIINEGTVSYVKVKDDDGTIRKTEVTAGFSDGVNVEIQSGLSEGETVLIESQVTGI